MSNQNWHENRLQTVTNSVKYIENGNRERRKGKEIAITGANHKEANTNQLT